MRRIHVALLLLCLLSLPAFAGKTSYQYFAVGNQADVTTTTTAGTVLMGGGTDVDAAFQWMINKSGGGDFVVIRATGTDAYNPWVYGLGTVNSVETLIIPSRTAAADPFVIAKIRNAEALWIAGGDQSDYINFWKGTPVADAINYVANTKHAPVGGTSAGLAVLGQFIYTGASGSVTSSQALANPYHRYVTLDRDFVQIANMTGVITDSHFVTRDRLGRLVAFIGRIIKDGWASSAHAIGIDEATAILVEPNGSATRVGSGAAYFFTSNGVPLTCVSGSPLTYTGLAVYKVSGSATFNIATWAGSGGTAYTVSATSGAMSSSNGSIY
ncbi:MAG: cyanophycinase [Acidobacteriota bacterium]|jgi:cyanophycinase|nr:cyanophycinase [Acidobacteriota bacterium]